jgi:hypothetical protein
MWRKRLLFGSLLGLSVLLPNSNLFPNVNQENINYDKITAFSIDVKADLDRIGYKLSGAPENHAYVIETFAHIHCLELEKEGSIERLKLSIGESLDNISDLTERDRRRILNKVIIQSSIKTGLCQKN